MCLHTSLEANTAVSVVSLDSGFQSLSRGGVIRRPVFVLNALSRRNLYTLMVGLTSTRCLLPAQNGQKLTLLISLLAEEQNHFIQALIVCAVIPFSLSFNPRVRPSSL